MSEVTGSYHVFAEDRQVYGPAGADLLQQWASEGLVSTESWIYESTADGWKRAKDIPLLKGVLAEPTPLPEAVRDSIGLRGSQLRRIRLFADMTDEQAETFINLLEKIRFRAFSSIVKHGEHGDSMFLLMDGEARVSVRHAGKEEIIAVLGVGDFFGEIALLDQGPRSTDVIANKDCTVLQLSKENFERIVQEHPDLASRFLIAMNRFLGGRIRATNERFTKAQSFARGASGQVTAPSAMKWNKGF